MGEYVGLEIRGLGESLVTVAERASERPVPGMNSHVCAQVEVEREPLATAVEWALK